MAVINLLPTGSAAATSASFTLTGGQTMTLAGAARAGQGGSIYWSADIERQMSDGAWEPVGALSWETKMLTLYGDGEYRVRRPDGSGCMVDGALA